MSSNLKNFFFNELKTATRNFRPDSMVGEGGFGCVFKGWVDENALTAAKPGTGMVIAVKRLNQEGLQGHKEWLVSITTFICLHSLPWSIVHCFLVSSKLEFAHTDGVGHNKKFEHIHFQFIVVEGQCMTESYFLLLLNSWYK